METQLYGYTLCMAIILISLPYFRVVERLNSIHHITIASVILDIV